MILYLAHCAYLCVLLLPNNLDPGLVLFLLSRALWVVGGKCLEKCFRIEVPEVHYTPFDLPYLVCDFENY